MNHLMGFNINPKRPSSVLFLAKPSDNHTNATLLEYQYGKFKSAFSRFAP